MNVTKLRIQNQNMMANLLRTCNICNDFVYLAYRKTIKDQYESREQSLVLIGFLFFTIALMNFLRKN